MRKKKILVISDHPLSPSGVGTQTKNFCEALLKTGRYKFVCLGGAIKHNSYEPITIDPWGSNFIVYPVNGYGTHEIVRSTIQKEKPDALWFMTDPRFYVWLWEIENEIRANIPMIYYHVWDNFPYPQFNNKYYSSTDEIVAISKVTDEIIKNVTPDSHCCYIPHAVNSSIFHKLKDPTRKTMAQDLKEKVLSSASPELINPNKKIFFWNNRNARRKQSGTLVWWFKEFLDEVGHDKACLLMHTDPRDQHGQDLPHIIEHLGVDKGQIFISSEKVDQDRLADMYNIADFTINISDAEGFGLATLESLSCGTPIIVNMTGGLQEQVTNGKEWFGWGIEPASKVVIGSLQVPYIYEDRISKEDFISVMKKAINVSSKAYKKMSEGGMKHVKDNYNFDNFETKWIETMDDVIERHGSWQTRKNYARWRLKEVA
tara:strand:- start:31049 stop:32335 length:1287 start_codon:yes stop_codon:yes gene_type:complete